MIICTSDGRKLETVAIDRLSYYAGEPESIRRYFELSELEEEIGFTCVEMALDSLEDDGQPIPTGAELESIKAECDANADRLNEIEAEMDALREGFTRVDGRFWPPKLFDCFGQEVDDF